MTNELIEASFHDAPGHLSIEEASAWADGYNAALSAASAAGYRLVPVEPTPEMMAAYHRASIAPVSSLSLHGYRAMLAAAPEVGRD